MSAIMNSAPKESQVVQEYSESQDLIKTLREVLYPGAKKESVDMILAYCKAAKIDPLLKSLHITQVNKKEVDVRGNEKWVKQDVVMPGIGLYRTQAERSNSYIGLSEPEFGEDVTVNFDGLKVTYPKWCKITVKRWVNGVIAEYTAKEFWTENYATESRKTTKPNGMWAKRPYGQLAKCTEAQALRKAFPSLISQQPTSEEMSGKEIEGYPNQELVEKSNVINSVINKLQKKDISLTEKVGDEQERFDTLMEYLLILCDYYEEISKGVAKYLEKLKLQKIHQLTLPQAEILISKVEEKHPEAKECWENYFVSKGEQK